MTRWIRTHPLTSFGGLSLLFFYLFALGLRLAPLEFVVLPAYLFRALTGSLLYFTFPGVVDYFWLQEPALVVAYFTPLLIVDAIAVRYNRAWYPFGGGPKQEAESV
jgi:hypothetical protein